MHVYFMLITFAKGKSSEAKYYKNHPFRGFSGGHGKKQTE
jgi:hypothetical protein